MIGEPIVMVIISRCSFPVSHNTCVYGDLPGVNNVALQDIYHDGEKRRMDLDILPLRRCCYRYWYLVLRFAEAANPTRKFNSLPKAYDAASRIRYQSMIDTNLILRLDTQRISHKVFVFGTKE